MCTALNLTSNDGFHFLGRNLDLNYNFNQAVTLFPRNFIWKNILTEKYNKTKYAILGMASIMKTRPLLADGFNEKGLSCAALELPHYTHYENDNIDGKTNLIPSDLIFWILSNFQNVYEVSHALRKINLVNKSPLKSIPAQLLHWIVYDTYGNCIVIEKTSEKLTVYDNKIGVLTNAPTFDWHIANLNQYTRLSPKQPKSTHWGNQKLTPTGVGAGLLGLPGDFYPPSRFIRAAFFKNHSLFLDTKDSTLTEIFHILNNVAMFGGAVLSLENKEYVTLYTSCMCLESGTYYYKTYENSQINAIEMFKENLDADTVKIFKYKNSQSINFQN